MLFAVNFCVLFVTTNYCQICIKHSLSLKTPSYLRGGLLADTIAHTPSFDTIYMYVHELKDANADQYAMDLGLSLNTVI